MADTKEERIAIRDNTLTHTLEIIKDCVKDSEEQYLAVPFECDNPNHKRHTHE